jgi:hypothetical protein
VLFPKERICRYSEKARKVLGMKRPQPQKLAFQNWLKIKGHSPFCLKIWEYRSRRDQLTQLGNSSQAIAKV